MGAAAVPAVLGGIGLYQANQQQRKQNKALDRASRASSSVAGQQLDIMKLLRGLAEGYDPAKETDAAVGYASDRAGQTLEQSLRGLKVGYGGSNPSGDTNFHLSAQRATNDALDPLKAFAANAKANETAKKASLFQAVLGVPAGNLTQGYFNTAAMTPGGNAGPSALMLSQALQRLFAQNPQDQSLMSGGGFMGPGMST